LLAFGVAFKTGHKPDTIEEYFLAGRKLPWWLIGCALQATGISTEQTVAITGLSSRLGFAVSSYQLLASISLVIISLFILPIYFRVGINTIPEYLEYRFDRTTRVLTSFLILILYILGPLGSVLYSGAMIFETFFGINKLFLCKL
jgi:SSS family solute:Na+ symporter